MATRKEERWITGKEATAILAKNAGRPIPDSYIRTLARAGKVDVRQARANESIDGRTNLYRERDVRNYVVQLRDQGKGQSRKARVPKTPEQGQQEATQATA